MVYQQVVGFFGGVTKAAGALGLAKQTVDSWKDRRIPSVQQFKAHLKSDGRLKLDAEAKRDAREMALYIPIFQEQERRAA